MKYAIAGRRSLATALSGTLVAGAVAGTVVGAAGPAAAAEVPIEHEFTSTCNVNVGGDLNLGDYDIEFSMATTAEVPLVPGADNPKQDVSVMLTMPEKLHAATVNLIKATHASGGSPNSAVNLTLPIAGGTKVTERIALKNLTAPKKKIPALGNPWTITSTGVVPKQHVPGFAGAGDAPSNAALKLAPKFTIKSTLFAGKKKFPTTMKCTVKKADRVINDAVPVGFPYVTDTLPASIKTTARTKASTQLTFFNAGPNPDNSNTKPEHGKLTIGAKGKATYTPKRNFVGKDSFTYTAKDDSGESTSKVTITVKKASSRLQVRAPKAIKFGKRATVRVTVKSKGAKAGPVRLVKGKRVLAKAKAGKAGKAKLTIKRKALKVGKHKLQVKYAGSKTAKKATKKLTLRVKKR
ncbi:Ig-like domain-containing protein [Solicola gregarius]|uniref:Ig-like domain-containing protein n=1 Tax=Solicola gregarius TaxID=2908642 RepID=A0AA46YM04_9ACTN|nr:Ig-like domain-containing protein [Solicola gregarius]UYM07212.1 Ig-like domain-containing protein [Solicola gregarius]